MQPDWLQNPRKFSDTLSSCNSLSLRISTYHFMEQPQLRQVSQVSQLSNFIAVASDVPRLKPPKEASNISVHYSRDNYCVKRSECTGRTSFSTGKWNVPPLNIRCVISKRHGFQILRHFIFDSSNIELFKCSFFRVPLVRHHLYDKKVWLNMATNLNELLNSRLANVLVSKNAWCERTTIS